MLLFWTDFTARSVKSIWMYSVFTNDIASAIIHYSSVWHELLWVKCHVDIRLLSRYIHEHAQYWLHLSSLLNIVQISLHFPHPNINRNLNGGQWNLKMLTFSTKELFICRTRRLPLLQLYKRVNHKVYVSSITITAGSYNVNVHCRLSTFSFFFYLCVSKGTGFKLRCFWSAECWFESQSWHLTMSAL